MSKFHVNIVFAFLQCLIMVAKKHKLLTGAGYILSSDPAELSPQSEYCVGKISSNFIGTEFTLYSGRSINSNVPHNYGVLMNLPKAERFREELASVIYVSGLLLLLIPDYGLDT